MKRILAILLSAFMMMGSLPVDVHAEPNNEDAFATVDETEAAEVAFVEEETEIDGFENDAESDGELSAAEAGAFAGDEQSALETDITEPLDEKVKEQDKIPIGETKIDAKPADPATDERQSEEPGDKVESVEDTVELVSEELKKETEKTGDKDHPIASGNLDAKRVEPENTKTSIAEEASFVKQHNEKDRFEGGSVASTREYNTDATFDPIWPCESSNAYYVTTVYWYYSIKDSNGNPKEHSTKWKNRYNALDISGGGNIVAAEKGKVTFSGTDFGNTVIIEHENGYHTFYGHLASRNVKEGDVVHRGQVIGVMGNTGNSTGVHLHFECKEENVWYWFRQKYASSMIYGENVRNANEWAYKNNKGNMHLEVCNWLDTYYRKSDGWYVWNGKTPSEGGNPCNCTTDYAGDYVVTTNSSPLTIRSGHGTGFSKIGEIPKGATCHVSKGDGTWAHVEYNGVNGYASMQYLARVSSSSTELDYRFKFPFSYQYRGERLFTYDAAGGARSGYVDDKDDCTVNEVYASGWIKVTFPNSSTGGTLTRYSTLTEFLGGGVNPVGGIAPQYADAYYDSARSAKRGNVDAGDEIVKLREENGSTLVQYPVGSEWRCAWVETEKLANSNPAPTILSVQPGQQGNDTVFTWAAGANTHHYNLYISRGTEVEVNTMNGWDLEVIRSYINNTGLGISVKLAGGWYKAYIDSCNEDSSIWTCSNQVAFYVPVWNTATPNIEDGTYMIVPSANTGLAVGIQDHGTWNNANIQLQWRNDNDPYQKWRLQYEGDGFYRVWNDVTGKVMDACFANGFVRGMNIEMYPHIPENTNQLFAFFPNFGCGDYFIPVNNPAFQLNLDVVNTVFEVGTNIQLWEAHTGDAQKFQLIRVSNKTGLGAIELGQTSFEFQGNPVMPEPVVKDVSGYVLRKDIDYVLSYEHSNGVGTATVTANGIGAYEGTVSANYTIYGVDLGNDFWAVIRTSLIDYPNRRYVGVNGDGRVILASARDDNYDSYLWHFVKRSDGSYNLFTSSNAFGGMVMDNIGYNDSDHASIIVNNLYQDSTAEEWDVFRNGDGYGLSPRYTERVMDVYFSGTDDGTAVNIHEINHYDAQKFYIEKVLTSFEQTIPNGVYNILAAGDTGFGLSILSASGENGANVHLWNLQDGDPYMMWEFTYLYNGYYRIKNIGSGKALDVNGVDLTANVQQWDRDDNSARQRWQVIPFNGNYRLVPDSARHTALDVTDGAYFNGNNIFVYAQHDGIAEQFVLRSCSYDISGYDAWLDQTEFEFTGYPVTPELHVRNSFGNVLAKDVHYNLTYERNCGVGTATVTAMGIWPYTGSVSRTFNLYGTDLGDDFWAVIRTSLIDYPNRRYVGVNGDGRVILVSARDDNYDSYLWHFVKRSDGSYNLFTSSNAFGGMVMDNVGYNDSDHASIIVNNLYPDSTAEEWDVFRNGDGYGLSPRYTERVMDVYFSGTDDGTTVNIHAINHSDAQKFYISKVLVSQGQTIPDGTYCILSSHDPSYSLAIDCDGNDNGANVHLWSLVRSNQYMMWEFTYLGNGYYRIKNLGSDKVLDLNGSETGANVQLWQWDENSARQRWAVIPFNGAYRLIPDSARHTALDIVGGEHYEGNNIQVYEQHDDYAEQFTLLPCRALDVNGTLDGNNDYHIAGYGTVEVFVDGKQVSKENVEDFWGLYPIGSTYEVKNLKTLPGKAFIGFSQGAATGTIGDDNVDARLNFKSIDYNAIGNPARTEHYNGHTYMYFDNAVTWYEANEYCQRLGGHLATITSQEENDFLSALAGGTYWLGATDRDSEQSWQWITGESFGYAPWESGQPDNWDGNDERSENYLCGNWPNWNDYPGYTLLPYVCEIEKDQRILSVELSQTSFEFEGSPVMPEPVVKDGNGNVLRKDIDYSLSYVNNQGIGTAEVIATGIGECSGQMSASFEIKGLDLGDDFWAYMEVMGKTVYYNPQDRNLVFGKDIVPSEMLASVWHFTKNNHGSYTIWSPVDGFVLDVQNYNDFDGAVIEMYQKHETDESAQCWNIFRMGDGFGLMPECSHSRVVEYTGAADMSDAPLQLFTLNGNNSQTFKLVKLDSENSTAGYAISLDNAIVAPGETARVTVNDASYVINYVFHIVDENGNETVIDNGCNNIYEFTSEQPGTYTVYAEVSSPVSSYTGSAGRDAVTITVARPLGITSQPRDAWVENGQKAATSVAASGDGLSYQWFIKNKGATKFSKSSVTKVTYSTTMSDSVDGRQVYCVVTDKYGNSETSKTATLNKYIPLSIVIQPSDAVAEIGKTTSATVVAEGSGLSYQWYIKNRTATKFSKSSIKTDTYSVTMSDAVDGRQVYCIVTDVKGIPIATNIVTLRKGVPVSITSQPQDTWVENGQKATASVAASGDGLSYQWYIKNRTATSFSRSSVTKPTYSTTMSDSVDGRQVYCVVTDSLGNSETSETATLNKYIPLSIVTQPSDAIAENGKTVSVSIVAEGSGLSYQWYFKNRTATKFSKSSITEPTYIVIMSDAVDGRQVYCVVTDMKGNSIATKTVTLGKGATLVIVTQPQDCYVANGEKATATVVAEGEDLTYQWYIKNKRATKFSKSSVTKAIYSTTMSDAVDGRQVYCIVTDKYGNTVQTDTATLHKQGLSIVTQPHDVSVENGRKAAVTVVAEGEGLTYQWYIKNRTATKFSKSSIIKDTYSVTMSDTVDGRQVYCVITDANGNTVQTNTVTLSKK